MADLTATVAANLANVRQRIATAGGDPASVTVVAVAKRFDAAVVRAAMAAGLDDVGQSYAQELLTVAGELEDQPRWHFVGRVQRNKVAKVAPLVWCWHSVDRAEVAAAIAHAAPGARVLVQVNTTREPQKGGCSPDDVGAVVGAARAEGLDVRGLMTVGPQGDRDGARRAFRELARLADDLGLAERSMGMSDDLEVAVEEGATIVRVGTALFGPRQAARTVGN